MEYFLFLQFFFPPKRKSLDFWLEVVFFQNFEGLILLPVKFLVVLLRNHYDTWLDFSLPFSLFYFFNFKNMSCSGNMQIFLCFPSIMKFHDALVWVYFLLLCWALRRPLQSGNPRIDNSVLVNVLELLLLTSSFGFF